MDLEAVSLSIPENANLILGQSHFIKTVEDIYEAMVTTSSQIRFGVAFNEASGPCLTRRDGNDDELIASAVANLQRIGAGHVFLVVMRGGFPINVLPRLQLVPEVVQIFCATANPVQVVVAQTEQGRGVLGVVDGFCPKGVESEADVAQRHSLLRTFGYKR